MCPMMQGTSSVQWNWLLQGGPITWLVTFLALTAVVGLILASVTLVRALAGFVGRRWRAGRVRGASPGRPQGGLGSGRGSPVCLGQCILRLRESNLTNSNSDFPPGS